MKNKNFLRWYEYIFYIKEDSLLNNKLLKVAIDNFFVNRIENQKDFEDKHLAILVRIGLVDGSIKTLSKIVKIITGAEDKEYLYNIISDSIDQIQGGYYDVNIDKIIFSYGLFTGKIEIFYGSTNPSYHKNVVSGNYSHFKLPIVNPFDDVLKFGSLAGYVDNSNNDKKSVSRDYIIQSLTGKNLLIIKNYGDDKERWNKISVFKNGIQVLSCLDYANANNSMWSRTINSREYVYDTITNNELLMTQNKMIKNYIKPKKVSDPLDVNYVTLDIETYQSISHTEDGSHTFNLIPYLICYKTNDKAFSFHLLDYDSPYSMIKTCIHSLVDYHIETGLKNMEIYNKEYDEYLKSFHERVSHLPLKVTLKAEPKKKKAPYANLNIYAHNLGYFDASFLISNLISMFTSKKVEIVRNNNRIISINVKIPVSVVEKGKKSKKTFTLTFLDSYQLLPASLASLSKSLSKGDQSLIKTSLDHSKINQNNLLEYKDEAVKYCIQDCTALFNVITSFNKLILSKWGINIFNFPTISSLAFFIYKLHFLKDDKLIPQISGSIFNFIKTGYTGGSTDMIKPYCDDKPLYYYDVNSLYPTIMEDMPLPCGEVIYFEGNILKLKPDVIGFYYCEVETTRELRHPILQIHYGNRTVSPLGKFNGVFYSEEIKLAIKLGYKINIIKGYYFTKNEVIFKDYVNELVAIRTSYSKDNPMNYIAKLLLNSLYGRFGMDDKFNNIEVLDQKDFSLFMEDPSSLETIVDIQEFKDGEETKYLIDSTYSKEKDIINQYNSNYEDHNTSISIAAATTSLARIYMSKFKNNPLIDIFYTDTDSIIVTQSPDEMDKLFPGIINDKGLGKLKLEFVSKKGVFLAPKCYYLVKEDGTNYIKIKGVKRDFLNKAVDKGIISFDSFKGLLYKDKTLILNQEKWSRNLEEGTINIFETTYQIKQNDNKRVLVYNEDKLCVDTSPIIIKE